MAFEVLNLSIIPKGDLPVFHAKQYETGRPIIFDLVDENEDAYTPAAGDVIKLNCRKVDDNVIILSPDSVSGNRVTFTTTEQLTACSGDNICELRITDSEDKDIATINFILHVQKMPTAGGIDSDSVIDDITTQITNIISELLPEEVAEIAPDIIRVEANRYINAIGGRFEAIGTIYADNLIVSENVNYLTEDSYIDVYCTDYNVYVKNITVTPITANRSSIEIELDGLTEESAIVSIRFYNPGS